MVMKYAGVVDKTSLFFKKKERVGDGENLGREPLFDDEARPEPFCSRQCKEYAVILHRISTLGGVSSASPCEKVLAHALSLVRRWRKNGDRPCLLVLLPLHILQEYDCTGMQE